MTDESASSFSFTHPAAPAGGSQSGTSPSIETDGATITDSVRRSTPRKMIEPRRAAGSESQALMDVDRSSGKSIFDTPPATPKKKSRGEISPTPSRTNSPQQANIPSDKYTSPQPMGPYPMDPTHRTDTTGALTTTSQHGSYPMDRANQPPEVALPSEGIMDLRKALLSSEDRARHEELRCLNVWRNSEENARNIEMTAHDEFVIMKGHLEQFRTELQESMQVDLGSTYRIQELE